MRLRNIKKNVLENTLKIKNLNAAHPRKMYALLNVN